MLYLLDKSLFFLNDKYKLHIKLAPATIKNFTLVNTKLCMCGKGYFEQVMNVWFEQLVM